MNSASLQAPNETGITTAGLIFSMMQVLCIACCILQLFIDFSFTNIGCVLLVLTGCTAVIQYFWRSNCFKDNPISSIALLGLMIMSEFTSLLAQTLDWTAISSYLQVPLETFSLETSVLILTILSQWLFRHLSATERARGWLATRVFKPLGLIEAPPVTALWLLGIIGTASLLKSQDSAVGAGGKFVEAFRPFSWLPFLIPFYYRQLGKAYCNMPVQWVMLLAYSAAVALVGLALNVRTVMVAGPLTAAVMYLVSTLQSETRATNKHVIKLGILSIGFFVGIVLFAQVATAMVVVRSTKEHTPPAQLVKETITVLLHERHKMQTLEDAGFVDYLLKDYNEWYIRNPVLARFSETKFVDNVLVVGTNLDDKGKKELWDETVNRTLTTFPQTLFDWLGSKFNKYDYFYSGGDVYRYLATGNGLGFFVGGSAWVDLLVFTGAFFPLAVIAINLLTCLLLDSLSFKGGGLTALSPPLICMSYVLILFGFSSDSLAGRSQFFLRGLPQPLALYAIAYFLVMMTLNTILARGHGPQVLKETSAWNILADRGRGSVYRWIDRARKLKRK